MKRDSIMRIVTCQLAHADVEESKEDVVVPHIASNNIAAAQLEAMEKERGKGSHALQLSGM